MARNNRRKTLEKLRKLCADPLHFYTFKGFDNVGLAKGDHDKAGFFQNKTDQRDNSDTIAYWNSSSCKTNTSSDWWRKSVTVVNVFVIAVNLPSPLNNLSQDFFVGRWCRMVDFMFALPWSPIVTQDIYIYGIIPDNAYFVHFSGADQHTAGNIFSNTDFQIRYPQLTIVWKPFFEWHF